MMMMIKRDQPRSESPEKLPWWSIGGACKGQSINFKSDFVQVYTLHHPPSRNPTNRVYFTFLLIAIPLCCTTTLAPYCGCRNSLRGLRIIITRDGAHHPASQPNQPTRVGYVAAINIQWISRLTFIEKVLRRIPSLILT